MKEKFEKAHTFIKDNPIISVKTALVMGVCTGIAVGLAVGGKK